jgi:membrane glycosyltransferase
VLRRPGERRAFGGAAAVLKGMMLEILLSIALAPILMVANTQAVRRTLGGHDVGWRPQRRESGALAWRDACRAMAWQMFTGAAFVVALCFRPDLAVCFAPIVLPLLLAPVLARVSARREAGEAVARAGFLMTPDDHGVSATPVVFHPAARPAQASYSPHAREPASTVG